MVASASASSGLTWLWWRSGGARATRSQSRLYMHCWQLELIQHLVPQWPKKSIMSIISVSIPMLYMQIFEDFAISEHFISVDPLLSNTSIFSWIFEFIQPVARKCTFFFDEFTGSQLTNMSEMLFLCHKNSKMYQNFGHCFFFLYHFCLQKTNPLMFFLILQVVKFQHPRGSKC